MLRLTICVLPLLALLLGGCGEPDQRAAGKRGTPESARTGRPDVPDSASAAVSATPEEVVRLWLDAAKRGDAAAMSALYTEELRTEKVTPEAYAWKVMSAGYRAVSWNGLGQGSAGKDEERRVTGHVVFRGADGVEHPENLVFRLAKRDGTWWIASIADFD